MTAMLFASICRPTHAADIHIVKVGETLSEIARRRLGVPVYGANGSLQALLRLNPQIIHHDRIRPQQRLSLTVTTPEVRAPAGFEPKVESQANREMNIREEEDSTRESKHNNELVQLPQIEGAVQDESPSKAEPSILQQQPTKPQVQSGVLGIGLGYQFARVDAKDRLTAGETAFISDMSPVLALDWRFKWSSSWSSFVEFGAVFENIADDVSLDAKRFLNGSGVRKSMTAGADFHWSEAGISAFGIGTSERLFSHVP